MRVIGCVVGGLMLSHQPLGSWSGVVQRRTESIRCSRSSRVMRFSPSSHRTVATAPGQSALPGHVKQEDEPIRAANAGAVGPSDVGGPPGIVRDLVQRGPPQREARGAARLRRDGRCPGDLPVGQGVSQRGICGVLTTDRAAIACGPPTEVAGGKVLDLIRAGPLGGPAAGCPGPEDHLVGDACGADGVEERRVDGRDDRRINPAQWLKEPVAGQVERLERDKVDPVRGVAPARPGWWVLGVVPQRLRESRAADALVVDEPLVDVCIGGVEAHRIGDPDSIDIVQRRRVVLGGGRPFGSLGLGAPPAPGGGGDKGARRQRSHRTGGYPCTPICGGRHWPSHTSGLRLGPAGGPEPLVP